MPDMSYPHKIFLAVVSLFLIVFLAYYPCLQSDFVNWDDNVFLTGDQGINDINKANIEYIFSQRLLHVYVPLTVLSFTIERFFFGFDPFIFHLTNILFHIGVTILVLFFALALGLNLWGAWLAALIFGLHPIHVESVAWITERKDVLYSFFYLLSLLSYWRYVRKSGENLWWLGLTYILGMLSLLSKPMALSLPFVLLILDWFFKRKFNYQTLAEKGLLFAMFLPIIWMSYVHNMRVPGFFFPQSLLLWIWCLVFYLRKFFFPDYFALFYPFPKFMHTMVDSWYLVYAGVFIVLVFSFWFYRRKRLYLFAGLFYLFSIFYLLRFDVDNDLNVVADRFMYLPCLGFCLLLGDIIGRIDIKRFMANGYGKLIPALLIGFFIFLAFKTNRQCLVWKNSVSLWEYHIKRKHEDILFYSVTNFKYAQALLKEKSTQRIINRQQLYLQDRQERGNVPQALYLSPYEIQKIEEIIKYLKLAMNYSSINATPAFTLGALYQDLGDFVKALNHYNMATDTASSVYPAYFEMGRIYHKMGQYDKALEMFRRTIEHAPRSRNGKVLYERVIGALQHTPDSEDAQRLYAQERESLIKLYFSFFGE